MHRQWPIRQGPKKLVTGTAQLFILEAPDGKLVSTLIDIDQITGHRFTGWLYYRRETIRIFGTYNSHDQTGSCSTSVTGT